MEQTRWNGPSTCNVPEIRIVDLLLGHLPAEDARRLQRHVAACPECQKRCAEWRRHLPQADAAESPERASPSLPAPRAYRRLYRRLLLRHLRRKWFRPARVMGLLSVAAAVILAVGIVSLFRGQPAVPPIPESPAADAPWPGEHAPAALFLDARTISLPVTSEHARSAGVYGQIWLNGHTEEMFFRLYGLVIDRDHDYQVWVIKALRRENAGLLHMDGEFAELYTQVPNIHEVQTISVSREPKGGSDEPTAPELILVDFPPLHNHPILRPE